MFDQITLHRTEVLKLLRHLHDIKTALSRSFDRYYQGEFDDIEDQLLAMKSEVDQILWYFENSTPNRHKKVVIQLCRIRHSWRSPTVEYAVPPQPWSLVSVWDFWHLTGGPHHARSSDAYSGSNKRTLN
jgi:hypothetical protein